MGISEDANAAADYIEAHGWFQGNYVDDNTGSVCMLGALALGDSAKACVEFHNSIAQKPYLEFLGVPDIPIWNDHPSRTKEEVVQVLRDVATKYMPDEMRSNTDA